MTLINVLAILFSPLIAVGVTVWLQHRKERRDQKRWIFATLIATRHTPITDEVVRALNMIDIVFHDSPAVRRLWREYFDMLGNPGLQNPQGFQQRQVKNLEMITEMAKVLGYGKAISHLDVDRVYYPVGLGKQADQAQAISDELLRVLRGSQGFVVTPLQSDNIQPQQLPPGMTEGNP
jgi:hypothetical protein